MTSLLQGLGTESGICKQWYDVQTKATFDFFFFFNSNGVYMQCSASFIQGKSCFSNHIQSHFQPHLSCMKHYTKHRVID